MTIVINMTIIYDVEVLEEYSEKSVKKRGGQTGNTVLGTKHELFVSALHAKVLESPAQALSI